MATASRDLEAGPRILPADDTPAATSPEISMVPVASIYPHPENPRLFAARDSDDPSLVELAQSLRTVGLLQPVLVRPHPLDRMPLGADPRHSYQLVAGERRWRAARLAGLEAIPAIVRELDDRAAIEILATENLQRQDLHPLEEARGIQALVAHGWTLADVAERQGRSLAWAARRARLNDLSPAWRQAIADPKQTVHEWPAGHLELVARLDPAAQDRFLNEWAGVGGVEDIPTMARVEEETGNWTHLLRQAPWRKDDEALYPEAGSCLACHKRSGCHPGLFDDGTEAPGACKGEDRCLDVTCWQEKKQRHVKARAAAARQEHGATLVLLAAQEGGYEERKAAEKAFGKALEQSEWSYTKAQKGDVGARPVLLVTGPRAGHVEWMKKRDEGQRYSSRAVDPTTGAPAPTPMKERRAALSRRRKAHAVAAIREAVGAIEPYPVTSATDLLALVAVFGTHANRNSSQWDPHGEMLGVDADFSTTSAVRDRSPQVAWELYETLREGGEAKTWTVLWPNVRRVLEARLAYQGSQTDVEKLWDDAEEMCEALGLDAAAHLQAAVEAIPEPKSWAHLNADGTPKTAKPKKGNKAKTVAEEVAAGMAAEDAAAEDVKRRAKPKPRRKKGTQACRECGCTETTPCEMANGEPCSWVEEDLCSACYLDPEDPEDLDGGAEEDES